MSPDELASDPEPRAHQRLAQIIDQRLVQKCLRWDREWHGPLTPLKLGIENVPRTSLEPEGWGLRDMEPREVLRPQDLVDALKQRMPQALLRDLHRPVRPVVRPPGEHHYEHDPAGVIALKSAKMAQLREALPTVDPLVREVVALQTWRRALLREPWKPYLDDEAPRGELR